MKQKKTAIWKERAKWLAKIAGSGIDRVPIPREQRPTWFSRRTRDFKRYTTYVQTGALPQTGNFPSQYLFLLTELEDPIIIFSTDRDPATILIPKSYASLNEHSFKIARHGRSEMITGYKLNQALVSVDHRLRSMEALPKALVGSVEEKKE